MTSRPLPGGKVPEAQAESQQQSVTRSPSARISSGNAIKKRKTKALKAGLAFFNRNICSERFYSVYRHYARKSPNILTMPHERELARKIKINK